MHFQAIPVHPAQMVQLLRIVSIRLPASLAFKEEPFMQGTKNKGSILVGARPLSS
jgi:hypothetical protein